MYCTAARPSLRPCFFANTRLVCAVAVVMTLWRSLILETFSDRTRLQFLQKSRHVTACKPAFSLPDNLPFHFIVEKTCLFSSS